jgi:hypothetical protein
MEDTFINLQEAKARLTRGRTEVHTFSKEKFDGVLKEGFDILEKGKKEIDNAFQEISSRRKGLAIFSIFAFLLAILILLKIREIERKKNG